MPLLHTISQMPEIELRIQPCASTSENHSSSRRAALFIYEYAPKPWKDHITKSRKLYGHRSHPLYATSSPSLLAEREYQGSILTRVHALVSVSDRNSLENLTQERTYTQKQKRHTHAYAAIVRPSCRQRSARPSYGGSERIRYFGAHRYVPV